MRVCSHCGFANNGEPQFCSNCGIKFTVGKKSGLSTGMIILLVFLGLAVIGGISKAVQSLIEPKNTNSSQAIVSASPEVAALPSPSVASLDDAAARAQALNFNTDKTDKIKTVRALFEQIQNDPKNGTAAKSWIQKLDKEIEVRKVIGEPPTAEGGLAVRKYLRQVLNDYNSSEFVEWSGVGKTTVKNEPYWVIKLRLRAKNAFGAYILKTVIFYIRNDQVVFAEGLD